MSVPTTTTTTTTYINSIHLMASFRTTRVGKYQNVKPSWILLQQDMMEVVVVVTTGMPKRADHITNIQHSVFTGQTSFRTQLEPQKKTIKKLLTIQEFKPFSIIRSNRHSVKR